MSMKNVKTTWRRCVLQVLILFFVFPLSGDAGWGKSVQEVVKSLNSTQGKAGTKGSKAFTITSIKPGPKKKQMRITFMNCQCAFGTLRESLKIYPPVRINWHKSHWGNNVLYLEGHFNPGQEYNFVLPRSLACSGRHYVPTVTSVRIPDLKPAVRFAEKGNVIERDSREMLHADLVNIETLTYRGLPISPLLANTVSGMLSRWSFEEQQEAILKRNRVLKSMAEENPEMEPFLVAGDLQQQIFFPGTHPNKWETFSIPLSFRKSSEKGIVSLVSLLGEQDGRAVESNPVILRITDMGLTYKISRDGLLVWVTSLRTGEPMEDVSVAVLIPDAPLFLGKTDENGLLVAHEGQSYKLCTPAVQGQSEMVPFLLKDVSYLAAASEEDQTCLKLEQTGNVKPDWVNQSRTIERDGRLIKGYVFTDRGIYRPGDDIHFKGTLREFKDNSVLPPVDIVPTFTIVNSKDEKIFEKSASLSEFGTTSDTFNIKPFFPLGTYTIHMKFGKGPNDKASRTFQVQEFRPPRHFTEIRFDTETKRDKSYANIEKVIHLLKTEVAGKYYAGGPVKHGKVRWKIYYTSSNYPQKEYPDYTFGNYMVPKSALLESGESILDEKGQIMVTFPMGREVTAGVYGLEVVSTVVDFDGRAATENAVFQKKPGYLVGIRNHPDEINAGDSHSLDIIVLDPKGRRIKKGPLNLEVMRRDYFYVKKRNEQGDVYWDGEEAWRKELSSTLAIKDGRAHFDFDFTMGGQYLLKFSYTGKENKQYFSSTRFNVKGYWYGWDYENRNRNFEKFSIQAEKSEVVPGDTLRLFLNPHRKLSKVLLTIERDRIIEYRVVDFDPEKSYLDIPITEAHIPNIYISVLGIVPRGEFPVYSAEFDKQAPTFLFGATNIEVRRKANNLSVAINAEDKQLKTEPGQEVTLQMDVTDDEGSGVESELAVGVVDESVLALTGYQTPSLDGLNRFNSPLSVFTGDLRAELIKQTPFGKVGQEAFTGGGGLAKSPDAPTTKARKDFRPVAYFNPSVLTDKKGRAQVKFSVPDTMTTYRVYVVACDKGSQFASNNRDLLVVKDFYMEPGLPRFFTKGDRFRFYVSAFNKTDEDGRGRFSLRDDDMVDLRAGIEEYDLKAFDRELIPVSGEATKPGEATLRFDGTFEDMKDAVELKIPVNSGYLLWNDVIFGTFKGSETINYRFPQGTEDIPWDSLGPDEVQVQVTVSGSPFLRMAQGLKYLLKFPYGCIEQTSSGVLALAALRGLILQGLIPGISVDETDKFLKKGIERILNMQTDSGGFGYWPGNIRPDRWGTLYAATALTFAHRSGYPVPVDRMNKAMAYLEEQVKESRSDERSFQGFAVYVLSLNKRLEKALFKKLFGEITSFPRQGALLLLMAAHEGGFVPTDELARVTSKFLDRRWEWKGDDIFYARYREPAIALIAAANIVRGGPQAGRFAKQLLAGVNKQGIWTSTSDTGWSLVALGEYFKDLSFADRPVSIRLKQEGQEEQKATIEPRGFTTFSIRASEFIQRPSLRIQAATDKDMVYMLTLMFPRTDFAEKGYANGFQIKKTIENTDGSKVIRVGDVVKVTLDMEINEQDFRYVVLDDPLPAGLVAINSALKTEEEVPGTKNADNEYWWDYYDYEGGFYRFVPNFFEIRDDRVLVFKDRSWKGVYKYMYYARAVAEGEFVVPSTKIQLMYEPNTVSFTPAAGLAILGR